MRSLNLCKRLRLFLIFWPIMLIFIFLFPSSSKFAESTFFSIKKDKGRKLNSKLVNLKPNIWIKVNEFKKTDWYRQEHAGAIYDSRRGTILIFGSDTHGLDWDNEIHEFNPVEEKWSRHYRRARKESYRADEDGMAVSGYDRLLPWAMHTFDNIVYDPKLDSFWVTAIPAHNPMRLKINEVKIHPTWIYDLKSREWKIFRNKGVPPPNFFASASAYDSDRETIIAYKKGGVWEIGPDRDEWKHATDESHHEIHFTMEYDTKNKKLAVFGDYHRTNAVWVYNPGSKAGSKGKWEKKIPLGDLCPEDQHFPVAFDVDNGVFLLVPDNWQYEKDKNGKVRAISPKDSSTFVYNLATNSYYKLPNADMKPLGMNYMMVYDQYHKAFLLITGNHGEPTIVWALKLDLKALDLRR